MSTGSIRYLVEEEPIFAVGRSDFFAIGRYESIDQDEFLDEERRSYSESSGRIFYQVPLPPSFLEALLGGKESAIVLELSHVQGWDFEFKTRLDERSSSFSIS